jgi:hypothetical protein
MPQSSTHCTLPSAAVGLVGTCAVVMKRVLSMKFAESGPETLGAGVHTSGQIRDARYPMVKCHRWQLHASLHASKRREVI